MPWICGEPECKKQPYYAEPGSKKPKFCFLHKHVGHIDVRNKRCEVPNCEIRPHYGYDGEAPRFCAQHRAEGMHNLRSRRCQSDGCVRYASCGHAGNPPVFCGAHKTIGMVNLIGRRCAVDNCETYASYGNTGEKARYCAKHKDNDMVNLTVKHCEFQGCVTQPSFNYAGQRKAKFCARHRLEHMVDVLDRHCAQHGCDRQPIYGQAGEKEGRPMWCPDHRPAGSFDVKTSRCQEPGCLKHPSYGYDRDRIRRRCRLHKLDDMVDVKSPRCEMVGCRKQPCCGFPGLKPRFCSEHKQDGMLNLKTRAFRCKYRGPANREPGSDVADDPLMPMPAGKSAPCNRACRFAYPGEEAIYCAKHKLPGMVDVVNPTCKMQDCPEEPTHGYDGESATFCHNHMAVGMKAIPVLRPAGLHWSAELRRQATQTARERSKLEADMETGSARCTPLPPKASTLEEKRLRQQEATMAAIEAAAANVRGSDAQAAYIALNSREMLSASTAPIVPPFINERDMGPASITSAELALAFSGLQDDDMGGAAAASPGPNLPGIGADNNLGRIPQAGESESGPTRKRRRPVEASPAQSVSPASPNAYASAAASAAAAAAAAAASAAASASSFGDPAIFQAAYSTEFMASMAAAAAAGGMPPPLPPPTNATATPGGMIGMEGMPAMGAVLPMVTAGSSAPAPTPMDTTPLMMPAMNPPLAAVSDAMLTNPVPSTDPAAIAAAAVGIPQSTIAGAPVVPPVGSKCAVADCVAPATFGHPGPGHVPTHCLTHCEEGMHRLAADEARAPLGAKMAGKGLIDKMTAYARMFVACTMAQGKRKADDALVPASPMQASTDPVAATTTMEEASAYVAPVSPVAEMSASLTATTLPMTTDTVPSTSLAPATAVTTSIAEIPSISVGIAAAAAPVMAPVSTMTVSPPISAPAAAPVSPPAPAPVVEELGRGKRIKKRTAVAHEGMMLLAGAVASHSNNAGEEDDEETDLEDNSNVSAAAMVASTNAAPTVPV